MNCLSTAALTALALAGALAPTATARAQQTPLPPLGAELTVVVHAEALKATVHADEPGFLGAVLLSTSPARAHYLVGLPPLLADHAVLGVAAGDGKVVSFLLPYTVWPAGLELFGQGLVLDSVGLHASQVVAIPAPKDPHGES